ncbi:MAG: sigma-70 family RNA polymerase sigma factor [Ignavibacteriales bacterium]
MGNLSGDEFHSLLDQARSGDPAARDRLVQANKGLVVAIAGRFRRLAGDEFEDILQVAYLGLLKAIDGFDSTRGTRFSTYAFPVITGEIRRYLRDSGLLHVDRSIRESSLRVARARQAFEAREGREPTLRELASEAGLAPDEVVEALESAGPLHYLDGARCDLGIPGRQDESERVIEDLALRHALSRLEPRERMLISLRYRLGLSQEAVASRLGISQAQVSRHERKALDLLRRMMSVSGEACG